MTERERFESWFAKEMNDEGCELSEFNNGDYRNEVTQSYWLTWRSALASQQPSDDGWVDWAGGNCPVGQSQGVEVKLRGGYGDQFYGNPASYFEWTHNGLGLDIIAYRVVKP